MEAIRLLIADDHPLVRCGIRETLRAAGNIALVGEASRGEEVQRLCRELQPDVLLLDLQMPGATAIETVAYVREHCSPTRVIILTAYDDEIYVRRMLAVGVDGYVLKDEIAESVISAVHSVMQGGAWISRRVLPAVAPPAPAMQRACDGATESDTAGSVSTSAPPLLTRQQRKVLRLIEEGLSNGEAADRLCISPRTIKKHLEDIFERLQVHDRQTAARVARARGYLT